MPKLLALELLGIALSEKQISQVIENHESGGKSKEALAQAELRQRQIIRVNDWLFGAEPNSKSQWLEIEFGNERK